MVGRMGTNRSRSLNFYNFKSSFGIQSLDRATAFVPTYVWVEEFLKDVDSEKKKVVKLSFASRASS